MIISPLREKAAGASKATVFFAGWAGAPEMFAGWQLPDDGDCFVVYDYREWDAQETADAFAGYESIRITSWSFGVRHAYEFAIRCACRIEEFTAVNGTLLPIDRLHGIAPRIMDLTVKGMNSANFEKFKRSMCGSSLAEFVPPERDIRELVDELSAINMRFTGIAPDEGMKAFAESVPVRALIGKNDKIIPSASQTRFWNSVSCASVTVFDGEHYDKKVLVDAICGQKASGF